MANLRRYSTESVRILRDAISQNLDWYYAPTGDIPVSLPAKGVRESNQPAPESFRDLSVDLDRPSAGDATNALIVFGALDFLTPYQATLEPLWTYLCHSLAPQYVVDRWLNERPSDPAQAQKDVLNHYFARDARGFIRDNALSRLWWLGRIAHDVGANEPGTFLEILLYRQDVRSALIERPSLSMNRSLLRAIYEIMRESWESDKALFGREPFRKWMVGLNRRGGTVLLDVLPDATLATLVRAEAERALQ